MFFQNISVLPTECIYMCCTDLWTRGEYFTVQHWLIGPSNLEWVYCTVRPEFLNITQINSSLYLLTAWCRVLREKLTGSQLVKKFPAFHGTRRFITALNIVRHLSLSWASTIQSIYLHPTSCRSILILPTHLRLGLPSGLLPSGFPTKTLYTPLSSPIRIVVFKEINYLFTLIVFSVGSVPYFSHILFLYLGLYIAGQVTGFRMILSLQTNENSSIVVLYTSL